jgi:Kef-type K+ transport system membrane component KefB
MQNLRNLRVLLIPGLMIHLVALARAIPLWADKSRVAGRFGQLAIGTHALIDLMLVAVLVLVFGLTYSGPVDLLRGHGLWRPPAADAKLGIFGLIVRMIVLGLLYWFAWRFTRVIITRI